MRGFSKLKHIMSKGLVSGILALAGLSLVLAGCASSQEAQTKEIPRIGFLSASATPSFIEALRSLRTSPGVPDFSNIGEVRRLRGARGIIRADDLPPQAAKNRKGS